MPFHLAPHLIINATLYTLLIFSVITWFMILFKSWQFSQNRLRNKRFGEAFWQANDFKAAATQFKNVSNSSKARVAASGFTWLAHRYDSTVERTLKFRGSPQDLLGQVLLAQAQEEQKKMESGLTLLASIGSTAPFIGLFGTVLGIMHAMHEISASGNSSLDVVAGPIGDALIATAIGIAVAVPAVLAYNFLLRRAKHHRASLEHFVAGFLHIAFDPNGRLKKD